MDLFNEKYDELLNTIGTHKNMVLSTCANGEITSRMMSVIQINGKFYFQTDIVSGKAMQIMANEKVSLCFDNVSINGNAIIMGKANDSETFCKLFKEYYPSAYELYTNRATEVLFEITPKYVQRWLYEDNKPYIEKFDVEKCKYNSIAYLGK